MKSLIITQKLFHFFYIYIQFTYASFILYSIVDIITLPYKVNYKYQKVLNFLFHAATFSNYSFETVISDSGSKIPQIKISSDDIIF